MKKSLLKTIAMLMVFVMTMEPVTVSAEGNGTDFQPAEEQSIQETAEDIIDDAADDSEVSVAADDYEASVPEDDPEVSVPDEALPTASESDTEILESGTEITTWAELKDVVANASADDVIALSQDLTAGAGDTAIQVASKYVTIDLCGHTMDRNSSASASDGNIFQITGTGTLNLTDSIGGGVIKGGWSWSGGAVEIAENATLNISNVTISDNKGTNGGAIMVRGSLTIDGTVLENNSADDDGGAIYINGTAKSVSIKNAAFTGNQCAGNDNNDGGAVYHGAPIDITIEDTRFEENLADAGGAVAVGANAELALKDGVLTGNRAVFGGAVVVWGSVDIDGTEFSNNVASDDGGALHIYTPAKSASIKDATFNFNECAGNDHNYGGAIYHGADIETTIEDSGFMQNLADAGGAIYINPGTLWITGCTMDANAAQDGSGKGFGGALFINKGTTTMTGGYASRNTAGEGGAVDIATGATFIAREADFSSNHSTPSGAGAFSSHGVLKLTECTLADNTSAGVAGAVFLADTATETVFENTVFESNTAENAGGAIYIYGGTLDLTGCTLKQNKGSAGGAVYISADYSPTVTLNESTISKNEAANAGSGVYVGRQKNLTVSGKTVVAENTDTDVYLDQNARIAVGELTAGASIGVVLNTYGGGSFTTGFEAVMGASDTPDSYFFSDLSDYMVTKQDQEGYLSLDLDEGHKFLKRADRISTNVGQLGSTNWMSGISGERYLNEINISGTHDTAMNNLSDKGCPTGELGKRCAKTQKQYLDEMLNDGVRFIDMRMNNKYCDKDIPIGTALGIGVAAAIPCFICVPILVPALMGIAAAGGVALDIQGSRWPIFKDDNVNLWACHGRDTLGGTFYALDKNGDRLSIAQELEWIKQFLRDHPTETVIIDARYETQDPDGDGPKILKRFKGIMEELSQEKNPSTGESYVYWEDGKVGKKFDHWPQLKDCRGKIVLWGKLPETADTIGGIWRDVDGIKTKVPEGTYKDGEKRASNLSNFLKRNNTVSIPKNVMNGQMKEFFWIEMNTTDTSFIKTPIQLAESYTLPTVFGSNGLVNESRKGDYLGWFGIDAGYASVYRDVWITNFPDDLDYCSITVKSGPGETASDQVYKVLRGTQITIPGCIYEGTQADKFSGWKASTDNQKYIMNNTYVVDDNVTFTAQWADQPQTPVTIVWQDAHDIDGMKADSLVINYNGGYSESVSQNGGWTTMLSGDLEGDPVVTGIPEGYTVKMEGSEGQEGYTITLTHTPDVDVNASGTVIWEDKEDKDGIRPDSVTLHLYANGEEVKSGTASKGSSWNFDLGTFPRYQDGELIAYKLVEDEIAIDEEKAMSGYSNGVEAIEGDKNAITGFKITNTHEVTTSVVNARIEWDDDNDSDGLRPESVTVQYRKNGEPLGEPIVVKPDEDGNWTVGLELTYAEMQKISNEQEKLAEKYQAGEMTDKEFEEALKNNCSFTIEQEEIEGYTTAYTYEKLEVTGEDESFKGFCQILNTHEKKHKHGLTPTEAKDATCTKDGNTAYWTCDQGDAPCGKYFSDAEGTTEIEKDSWVIKATGHKWDKGTITKEASKTEEGIRTYTCTVCGETKTESIPKLVDPTDQMGEDGTPLGPGASQEAADKAITGMKNDKDPKGTQYFPLNLKSKKQSKTSVTITWSKLSKAVKYVIYGNQCGKKNKMKKLATVTTTKKTFKKIDGKKLKKGKAYKFIVVALDKDNKVVSTSKAIHVYTKGGKSTNHKSVKIQVKSGKKYKTVKAVTVKAGKTLKIRGVGVKADKGLKYKAHIKMRYTTFNKAVATITSQGTIRGLRKGTCTIFAYSQNGVGKKLKVTVK